MSLLFNSRKCRIRWLLIRMTSFSQMEFWAKNVFAFMSISSFSSSKHAFSLTIVDSKAKRKYAMIGTMYGPNHSVHTISQPMSYNNVASLIAYY